MAEYIEREAVNKAVKHALAKGLEPTQYIDIIPAADVAPVVHGKWDDSFDGITPYCTACGRTHSCMRRTPAYCPNCGAKMDGD